MTTTIDPLAVETELWLATLVEQGMICRTCGRLHPLADLTPTTDSEN